MKIFRRSSLLVLAVSLCIIGLACNNDDLTPYYMSDGPKLIAMRIEPPEVTPGDTVSFRLLVSGAEVSQQMTNEVIWAVGVGFDEGEYLEIGRSAYHEEFVIDTTVWNDSLTGNIPDEFYKDGWFDIPILATVVVRGKTLRAVKSLRLTENPVGMNPSIAGVTVQYKLQTGSGGVETEILDASNNKKTFDAPDLPKKNIAFTANMNPLGSANDRLLFLWKVSFSKNSSGRLYINTNDDEIEDLLGSGEKASEYRQSAVFSLKGEDGSDDLQTGLYEIYLIVRDKASNAQSRADYRFGLNFFYFTLSIND